MAKEEIMDATTVCRSFPQTPSPQIYRENILDTIDTTFEGETNLLVIEGGEGIGKTTLLAQFAKKYPNQTFSLFIKPTSRWTYDPRLLLLDLCSQINWVLKQEEINDLSEVNDGFLRLRIFSLQKLTRQKQFYFLVDGLEDIPEEENQLRETILEMLPFGLTGFQFLLTGDLRRLSPLIPKGVLAKSFPLTKFTLDETTKYLENLTDDYDAIEEIHRTCRGVPGFLASVRRIVYSGTTMQQLLEDLPSKIPQLFEIEWRTIDTNNEQLHILLAILAHSRERHTIQDLARITKISDERVKELLQELGFVIISSQRNDVTFISEAFRKFAENHLNLLKEQVNTYLIDDLLRNPDTNEALTYLPGYFEQAGRFEDLLTYLAPDDHFTKIVEHNQSLSPVRLRANLGISTALKLHRDEDLMRFCIQRAAIGDFDKAEVWRSEVEARIALHDHDAALALAQGTELKEDRLHLLAVIAKAKGEQGLQLEPELLEQMRYLYTQIDHQALDGGRAIDISTDLVYSLPDIAIELVEKANQADTDSSARDWAFAKLSLAAVDADREAFQLSDTLESIQSRIENPIARRLSIANSFLFRELSAKEVVAETATYEVIERLNLLRLWANVNRTREDAIDVVDICLRLIIQTTEYSPNAHVFRELAVPLSHTSNTQRAKQLIGTFDSQKDIIENLGPTEDYVRLQLLLAETESNYGDEFETVRNRFLEIYFYICDIDDLAIKTQCTARLVNLLLIVDPHKLLEDRDRIHSAVEDDMHIYIKQLLEATANHTLAARDIIRSLAKTHTNKALDLAKALNTESRRNQALVDLISATIKAPVNTINWNFVTQIIQQITSRDLLDKAHLTIMEELFNTSNIDDTMLPHLLPLLTSMSDIQDAEDRCRAYGMACAFIKKHDVAGQYTSLTDGLLNQLRAVLESIDEGWNRVNVGFEIAKILADTSQESAKYFIELTDNFKNEILLEVPSIAATYLACLQLTIRAYRGLLPKNLLREGDQERLTDLIDRVPSRGVRAELWSELSLHYYINHHSQDCQRIVNKHIKPLLEDIRENNIGKYNAVLSTVAPSLFCAHQQTTLDQIAALPQPHRDTAYIQICTFILRKLPPSEPFEALHEHDYQLTYDEIVDICSLLIHMEADSAIFSFIESIADSVIAARKKNRFSRQQLHTIAERLDQVIQTRLPSPRYIKHEGYVIAARIQIARIQREKQEVWLALLDQTRKIPNLSDKALVLSILATSIPREFANYKEVLEEAVAVIETIPVYLEKVKKYQILASMALSIDSSLSKRFIEVAMRYTMNRFDPNLHKERRGLIDLAYRLDPDFAAFLASRMDDDPARIEIKERISILEAKKKMENATYSSVNITIQVENYAKASWMSLGALNAGRLSTVHIEHTREFVLAAAKYPLEQTYPILAWTIENAVRRFANTDNAKNHLRPIYHATVLGVELAGKMAIRSSTQAKRARNYAEKSVDSSSFIIRPDTREMALQVLSDWFENEVKDYLIISDPFFGQEDLELLKLLNAVNPNCKVQILTSSGHLLKQQIPMPWEDAYRNYWLRISDQEPPFTEIVVVGTQTKKESPVHDRWWLTNGGGLRIGTSFNSLGIAKTSEISKLSPQEAKAREAEINQYLQRPQKQEHEGNRLLYSMFNL